MYWAVNCSGFTTLAMAFAAAIFMDSVMSVAITARAPLKIPGKASTLLIWFGKSERPVPTTAAPAARASSGMISGVGFAIGNTIAPWFIERIISWDTRFGLDTPINTSAPFITSANVPCFLSLLVTFAISACAGFNQSAPS